MADLWGELQYGAFSAGAKADLPRSCSSSLGQMMCSQRLLTTTSYAFDQKTRELQGFYHLIVCLLLSGEAKASYIIRDTRNRSLKIAKAAYANIADREEQSGVTLKDQYYYNMKQVIET